MTILITGGLGFIGSHVARDFLEDGHDIVVTRFGGETVAPFLQPYLGGRLAIENLDIASPHATIDVCRRHDIESIVHLAGPPIGAMSAMEEYRINMAGLLNIVEAARIVGARRVSIASSIAVYMGLEGPFTEEMNVRLSATHTIEASKKAEELLGRFVAEAGGVELIGLRLASIYGPLYRTLRHWPAQLVHAAVTNRTAPLGVPGTPPIYRDDHASDLCYILDCARGIRLVHTSRRLRHSAYNIGGGQDVTNGDFADIAASIFPDLTINIKHGEGPGNWRRSILDLSRVAADTGYEPRYSITQALTDYAGWLREGHSY